MAANTGLVGPARACTWLAYPRDMHCHWHVQLGFKLEKPVNQMWSVYCGKFGWHKGDGLSKTWFNEVWFIKNLLYFLGRGSCVPHTHTYLDVIHFLQVLSPLHRYTMGLIPTKWNLQLCSRVTASSFCRRRLPCVMLRSKMSPDLRTATTLIEQGHVRVGPEVVKDPAFLVTRWYRFGYYSTLLIWITILKFPLISASLYSLRLVKYFI